MAAAAPARRVIVRPHTWVAFTEDEAPHWEADYGSIREVPGRITRLVLASAANPEDGAWQAVAVIPDDAEPVCFWRTSIEISQSNGQEAAPRRYMTVIGWKRGDERVLLWGCPDGSVIVTDRDLDDL